MKLRSMIRGAIRALLIPGPQTILSVLLLVNVIFIMGVTLGAGQGYNHDTVANATVDPEPVVANATENITVENASDSPRKGLLGVADRKLDQITPETPASPWIHGIVVGFIRVAVEWSIRVSLLWANVVATFVVQNQWIPSILFQIYIHAWIAVTMLGIPGWYLYHMKRRIGED